MGLPAKTVIQALKKVENNNNGNFTVVSWVLTHFSNISVLIVFRRIKTKHKVFGYCPARVLTVSSIVHFVHKKQAQLFFSHLPHNLSHNTEQTF